ncbi:hypothetical protein MZE21_22475, partial [Escherichia coli]|nr:hypothetical protein [Escherichia coli]MCK2517476.1 hypothetical protein [Escherichia coli]MCK2535338.1 hypothetical protein [Escherichia coli]
MRYFILMFTFVCSFVAAQLTIVPQLQQQVTDLTSSLNSQEKKELTHKLESIFNNTQVQIAVLIVPTTGNDSNLLIVFYVQIMPDDFVMQLH